MQKAKREGSEIPRLYKKAPIELARMLNIAMLSALILAYPFDAAHETPKGANGDFAPRRRLSEACARSLAALVGAAVASLVRDGCIIGPPSQSLDEVADYAGCRFVGRESPRAGLEAALHEAREERVFLLQAGFAPHTGFNDEISDWLSQTDPNAVALRCDPVLLRQRLFPALAPVVGLAATRTACLNAKDFRPAGLARVLHAKPLQTRARRVV